MIPNRLRMVLPLKWVLRRELFFFFFLKKNSMIVRCVIYDVAIPGRYIDSAAFLKAKINNAGILVCSCFSYSVFRCVALKGDVYIGSWVYPEPTVCIETHS